MGVVFELDTLDVTAEPQELASLLTYASDDLEDEECKICALVHDSSHSEYQIAGRSSRQSLSGLKRSKAASSRISNAEIRVLSDDSCGLLRVARICLTDNTTIKVHVFLPLWRLERNT